MRYTGRDISFEAIPTVMRKPARGGAVRRVVELRHPGVDEDEHTVPDLAWQPRPRS